MRPERTPGVAYSITIRAEYANRVGMLGEMTSAIGEAGGDIGAIDIVSSGRDAIVRDITVNTRDTSHAHEIVRRVRSLPGVRVVSVSDPTFLAHLGGKIALESRVKLRTRNDLSMAYTPGVARVSQAIHEDPKMVWAVTSKGNAVAVVSDGTAVLGLGDIGPEAALPVMEGKCIIFKEFAGVNAWPLCLATKDPDEIVRTVELISPGFGGINLEDISGPRCFYIEERLKERLDIPVFHDDQHGTAVVVLAALTNALKVVGKQLPSIKLVVSGAGAAGIAVTRMLLQAGAGNIIVCDRRGALNRKRAYPDNPYKAALARETNRDNFDGPLPAALVAADVFIGVSGPDLLTGADVARMAKDAIVFALANPTPEIAPEEAQPLAAVMATGRSDYPNQINNCLCFPGLFQGLLHVRARAVNEEIKLAAAQAIASCVSPRELSAEYIIPSVFDRDVVRQVAHAVAVAAHKTGVAQRTRRRESLAREPQNP